MHPRRQPRPLPGNGVTPASTETHHDEHGGADGDQAVVLSPIIRCCHWRSSPITPPKKIAPNIRIPSSSRSFSSLQLSHTLRRNVAGSDPSPLTEWTKHAVQVQAYQRARVRPSSAPSRESPRGRAKRRAAAFWRDAKADGRN